MNSVKSAANYLRTILLTLLAGPMAVGSLSYSPDVAAAVSCLRTVTAIDGIDTVESTTRSFTTL
jgi:hypothetical protein